MPLLELLRTAIQALQANKLRAFLTTLGVIIGVLSIILLVSLGEGAKQYLTDTFSGLGSNLLQIRPGKIETAGMGIPPLATSYKLTRNDELALSRQSTTLDGVTGLIQASGTVRYGIRRRTPWVLGVNWRFDDIRRIHVNQGRFFNSEDVESHRRYAILGRKVLEELFGSENPLGKTIKINDSEFRIIGVTEPKGTTLGFDLDDLVLITETCAMDIFNQDKLDLLLAQARDKDNLQPAINEATQILKRRHNNKEDFTIISQDDILSTVNNVMSTISLVLLAIASIALVVGGVGIANIMLVSVRERTREIGVRRAVGAKSKHILLQFLLESVVISMLGGLVGLLLGAMLIYGIRLALPNVPLSLSLDVVAMALLFSALVGIFSGVVPARRAAALDPVEALRYE